MRSQPKKRKDVQQPRGVRRCPERKNARKVCRQSSSTPSLKTRQSTRSMGSQKPASQAWRAPFDEDSRGSSFDNNATPQYTPFEEDMRYTPLEDDTAYTPYSPDKQQYSSLQANTHYVPYEEGIPHVPQTQGMPHVPQTQGMPHVAQTQSMWNLPFEGNSRLYERPGHCTTCNCGNRYPLPPAGEGARYGCVDNPQNTFVMSGGYGANMPVDRRTMHGYHPFHTHVHPNGLIRAFEQTGIMRPIQQSNSPNATADALWNMHVETNACCWPVEANYHQKSPSSSRCTSPCTPDSYQNAFDDSGWRSRFEEDTSKRPFNDAQWRTSLEEDSYQRAISRNSQHCAYGDMGRNMATESNNFEWLRSSPQSTTTYNTRRNSPVQQEWTTSPTGKGRGKSSFKQKEWKPKNKKECKRQSPKNEFRNPFDSKTWKRNSPKGKSPCCRAGRKASSYDRNTEEWQFFSSPSNTSFGENPFESNTNPQMFNDTNHFSFFDDSSQFRLFEDNSRQFDEADEVFDDEELKRLLAEKLKQDEEEAEKMRTHYEIRCSDLFNNPASEISIDDIPWPYPAEQGISGMLPFLFGRQERGSEEFKKYLKQQKIRWHPDRFTQKVGQYLKKEDFDAIQDRVKEISQILNAMTDGD